MTTNTARLLCTLCTVLGFLSVAASIAIWAFYQTDDRAHAERFGIFVGLWAPTFFAIANGLALRRAGSHFVQQK